MRALSPRALCPASTSFSSAIRSIRTSGRMSPCRWRECSATRSVRSWAGGSAATAAGRSSTSPSACSSSRSSPSGSCVDDGPLDCAAVPQIPLVDVKAQYAPLLDELKERIADVLESGRFILGPEVKAFEEEAAAYLGVE